jgi:ethanolamine utilization protein EutP (predicted NTPase)
MEILQLCKGRDVIAIVNKTDLPSNADIEYIKNTEKFEKAKYILPVECKEDGYVYKLNAEKVRENIC